MHLTAVEGRVLGCLVEKERTTPQGYPLTDNALVTACNQSTSRDPVVAYELSDVRLAVRSLREAGLLRTVHRTGERSDKHQHQLEAALDLSRQQVAVLAVLLLRGPQTAAELRARSERLEAFDAVAEVDDVLDALVARDEPLVGRLPRQPGRKEARYAQLLTDEAATPLEAGRDEDPHEAPPRDARQPDAAPLADEVDQLRDQVDQLRDELAELRTQVVRLRTRVEEV